MILQGKQQSTESSQLRKEVLNPRTRFHGELVISVLRHRPPINRDNYFHIIGTASMGSWRWSFKWKQVERNPTVVADARGMLTIRCCHVIINRGPGVHELYTIIDLRRSSHGLSSIHPAPAR